MLLTITTPKTHSKRLHVAQQQLVRCLAPLLSCTTHQKTTYDRPRLFQVRVRHEERCDCMHVRVPTSGFARSRAQSPKKACSFSMSSRMLRSA